MGKQGFIEQLRAIGYQVEDLGEDKLAFEYVIPVGKFASTSIKLGFKVGEDFPMASPSGPHLSPRLLPLHPSNDQPHPVGGVHESPFGAEWEYWSRPFQGWNQTDRTVRAYMSHIRHLLDTQ